MAGVDSVEKLEDVIVRSAEQVAGQIRAAKDAISTVIFGQDRVIENTLVTILSGGHALLIGVPGLAKTKLVETLGITLGLDAKRIQFTPDLMPSDILGAEVLDESSSGKRSFRFISGPVFAQLLMADEINRASPRTQSALLQAMQEQHITVAGARHDLPKPFHVLATQNPLEQEGTYPLPEAQLDRFLLKIILPYPTLEAEHDIVANWNSGFNARRLDRVDIHPLSDADAISRCRAMVREVKMEEGVQHYVVDVVRRTRAHPSVLYGASPRASVALLLCSKALAAIRGRDFTTPDDVRDIARPVLRHRLALRAEAELEGVTPDGVITDIVQAAEVPR